MKDDKKPLPGIQYYVKLKSDKNTQFKDIKQILYERVTLEESVVKGWCFDKKDDKTDHVIFSGSHEDCMSFINIFFEVEYNKYSLHSAALNDLHWTRNSEDPKVRDLSERIYASLNCLNPHDCEWDVGLHLDSYFEERSKLNEQDDKDGDLDTDEKIEELNEKYYGLLSTQFRMGYGLVEFSDRFRRAIEKGYFNDYDGSGEFIDKDGYRCESVPTYDDDWSDELVEKYPYVVWYNK